MEELRRIVLEDLSEEWNFGLEKGMVRVVRAEDGACEKKIREVSFGTLEWPRIHLSESVRECLAPVGQMPKLV